MSISKKAGMDLIDKLLRKYDNSNFVIQLKARFLLYIFIALIILVPSVLFYSIYLNLTSPFDHYAINVRMISSQVVLLLIVILSLVLFLKGHFVVSAHMTLCILFAAIWAVMILDSADIISRLDTIVMVVGILSAAPIFISRRKSSILIYAGINICVLYLYLFYFRDSLNMPEGSFGDYLADNTLMIIFTAIATYNVISINNRALDHAEQSKLALQKSNMELQATMEELTASNEELEAQNEEMLRSGEEKNLLIREIHHRVKNNMQIISSLLNMQADTIQEPLANHALKDTISRIHSMASIHEKIYATDNFSRVDMALYIREITEYLISLYSSTPGAIQINHQLNKVFLSIDLAIPCGLLINEILTNSIKHGCKEANECHIDISIGESDGHIVIKIRDYGPGMQPELFKTNHKTSMGLQIIDALARQIGATVDLSVEHGTSFIIRFPVKN
jgi:two-component sensor histidine kinase